MGEIEVSQDFVQVTPEHSITAIHVAKTKGRLTLDEIRGAVKEEFGGDYYLLMLDLYHDPNAVQYDEDDSGDLVTLYVAAEVMQIAAEMYN